MSIYEELDQGIFASSTRKRLPICFCLDTSGSMFAPLATGWTRMDEVNAAFGAFIESIKNNPNVNASADIAVITFGGETELVQKFRPISSVIAPEIRARQKSLTPIGEAVQGAVMLLEKRKEGYKARGIKYYQPWLVVITDGEPEGKNAIEDMEDAIRAVNALEQDSKLVVFNIGIGDDVSFDMLKRLSVKREAPINVRVDNIGEFFTYLGQSSESVVTGKYGEDALYGRADDIPKGHPIDLSGFKI